jgi:hypothetical protein
MVYEPHAKRSAGNCPAAADRLAGCRGRGEAGASGPRTRAAPGAPVQTATLTGLYEGGDGPRRNQMCMIEREGRAAPASASSPGAPGDKNCSGSGTATREGNVLRLRLDGDESCALEARIDGRRSRCRPHPGRMPALLLRRRRADERRELRQGRRRAGGRDAGRRPGRRSALRRLNGAEPLTLT